MIEWLNEAIQLSRARYIMIYRNWYGVVVRCNNVPRDGMRIMTIHFHSESPEWQEVAAFFGGNTYKIIDTEDSHGFRLRRR